MTLFIKIEGEKMYLYEKYLNRALEWKTRYIGRVLLSKDKLHKILVSKKQRVMKK